MVKISKSLEAEFHNLYINPERKRRTRSHSCSQLPAHVGMRYAKISSRRLISHTYWRFDDTARRKHRSSKVNKRSLLRPARLHLDSHKLVLKPPTLILDEDKKNKKKYSSKFAISSRDDTHLVTSKKFHPSCKSNNRSNLKSSVSADDVRDLSSCESTSAKGIYGELSELAVTSKRENTHNSCSIQARMESTVPVDCDDTSIEELASYFDLFVHIPKKMSSMAEMMYI